MVAVFAFALLSGKPNSTPKEHPETAPPQRAQDVDPKSTGRPTNPNPQ